MPDMGTSQYTSTCLWPLFRIRGSGSGELTTKARRARCLPRRCRAAVSKPPQLRVVFRASGAVFHQFISHFLPLFCITNPTRFFLISFIPKCFRIFSVGSFFKFEVYGRNREEAVSFRHPKGDANGSERRQTYFS